MSLSESDTDSYHEKELALTCDVLVMLCGGSSVTHVAVVNEHTILSWDLVIKPIPTPPSQPVQAPHRSVSDM